MRRYDKMSSLLPHCTRFSSFSKRGSKIRTHIRFCERKEGKKHWRIDHLFAFLSYLCPCRAVVYDSHIEERRTEGETACDSLLAFVFFFLFTSLSFHISSSCLCCVVQEGFEPVLCGFSPSFLFPALMLHLCCIHSAFRHL